MLRGLGATLAAVLVACQASAQTLPLPEGASLAEVTRSRSSESASSEPGVTGRFLRDVGADYKRFFSKETAIWLGVGGGAALAVHTADQSIAVSVQESNPPELSGGATYGSQLLQVPVALVWWMAGAAAGSERHASAGRDLLRAQISVGSWTYAIKVAADRTRPNGDPHSFPSGHASTSFATATVLQEHYGWKVGVPAFVAAGYTAVSRVTGNQHWASDVVFGAALGIASGRTVTIHVRDASFSVAPLPVPGGGGFIVTALR